MTVYVFRDGKYVDKASLYHRRKQDPFSFPTPMISRMEPFESPVTGNEVSSWRQRDREMQENDCYDPRDLPADYVYRRGREVQLKEEVRADGERERSDDTG